MLNDCQIPDIKCQWLKKESLVDHFTSDGGRGDFVGLECSFKGKRFILGESETPELLQVNSRLAGILSEVRQSGGGYIRLYCSRKVLGLSVGDSTQKARGKSRPKQVDVQANVFGARRAKDTIGSLLSNQEVYLQDPLWKDDGFDYDNPHILPIAGISDVELLFTEQMLDLAGSQAARRQRTDWNAMLDLLPQCHGSWDDDSSMTDRLSSVLSATLLRYEMCLLLVDVGQ